jgi:hypothetical protein
VRIAFLLSGSPRTFRFCFPSVKKHILDVYNPDVFICTESDEVLDLYNPVGWTEEGSQDAINKSAWDLRVSKFGVPKYDLLKEKDLSATYKSLRVSQSRQKYEEVMGFKYDVILNGRFDVKYLYVDPIGEVKENTIYIPKIDAHQQPIGEDGLLYKGYSMQLSWFTSKTADILLGNAFFGERDYVKESGFQVNDEPEKLLKYMCDQHGIKPEYVNISMMIIKGTSEKPLAHDFGSLERFPEYL